MERTMCGCYYCKQIFEPCEIKIWVDNYQTAICPKCDIDAVMFFRNDETKIEMDEILKKTNDKAFMLVDENGKRMGHINETK